jgi:hypothetical protein
LSVTVAVSESQSLSSSKTTAQLGKFLDEYSEVAVILPVLAGLFVTSRLQLRGANALIVNLAIAAIARQVVHQLKQEAAVTLAGSNGVTHATGAAAASADTAAAAEDYKIIHSVPGRIRLRVPQLQDDRNFAKRLEKLLLADAIVSGVRINRAAGSIAIQYNDGGLSELELGMRLLQVLDQAKDVTITVATGATAA